MLLFDVQFFIVFAILSKIILKTLNPIKAGGGSESMYGLGGGHLAPPPPRKRT